MSLNVLIVSNAANKGPARFVGVAARIHKHSTAHVHCIERAVEEIERSYYNVIFVDDHLEGINAETDAIAVDAARKLKAASPDSWVYVLKRGIDCPEDGPEGINGYFPKRADWIEDVFSAASK